MFTETNKLWKHLKNPSDPRYDQPYPLMGASGDIPDQVMKCVYLNTSTGVFFPNKACQSVEERKANGVSWWVIRL